MIQLPSMSFRLIEAERVQHPVSLLYAVLGVTRAGYYAWRERCPSLVSAKTRSSQALIRRIFSDSQESYGAPRVQAALADDYGLRSAKCGCFPLRGPRHSPPNCPSNPGNCAHGEV